MTKYVHIVQVHPVENGEPNLYKVKQEKEFWYKERAEEWIERYNAKSNQYRAVYLGCVDDETGELV